MVVWSSVLVNNIFKTNAVRHIFRKNGNSLTAKGLNYVPARHSGDKTVFIRQSEFAYAKMKDTINLYLLVFGVPVGILIFYVNVFIGPAKLALVPEGYTPKHWEYHEHPISRFLARYLLPSPQESYERKLHNLFVKYEKFLIKQLENKVKDLIKERHDYQAWYFTAPLNKYNKINKELFDEYEFNSKGQDFGSIK